MNGDGLQDILTGSFSGAPQWLVNTKEGFGEPTSVLDKNDDLVMLSKFWDRDAEDWNESDRTGTDGLCTSVAAVDWDDDGDFDLLLGDYRDGGLSLRLNEGTATEAKFATTNEAVKVGDEPVAFEGGIGSPRLVDWDGDGLFDIVIGTIRGEVVLLRNAGSKGKPAFAEMTTLVKALPGDSGSKKVKKVPSKDGSPVAPGSSFHIEVVDYDGDGALDLLVGGRSKWLTGPEKVRTAEDIKLAKKLSEDTRAAGDKLAELEEAVTNDEEMEELENTEEYETLLRKYHSLRKKARATKSEPTDTGDFIWLFRRKQVASEGQRDSIQL